VEKREDVPYTHFRKSGSADGVVTWQREKKIIPSMEEIKKLAQLNLEDARKLDTEEKDLWLWVKIALLKRAAGRGEEIFSAEPIIIPIERKNILRDSFEQFRTTTDLDLRRDVRIHFLDEVSQDAGGLMREWLSILIEELFDPELHLFVKTNTKELSYTIDETAKKHHKDYLNYYYFTGQVIAKALYEKIPIKAYLSKLILKMILGQELKVEDIKYCDVELYNSIQFILTNTITGLTSVGTFTSYKKDPDSGTEDFIELKENGKNIEVDDSNKHEFANLLFRKCFIAPIEVEANVLINGFCSLLTKDLISVLDADELELFICGDVDIDLKDWQENTNYEEPYHEVHPVIKRFWEMLEKMPSSKCEDFLQFCTGSKRAPAEGFRGLRAANNKVSKFKIKERKGGGKGESKGFIMAHTCFNVIELPQYDSTEEMTEAVNKILATPECFKFAME
jgi:hypothetical protein